MTDDASLGRPAICRFAVLLIGALILAGCAKDGDLVPESKPLPRLLVSKNGRHLETDDGRPFFWLGDTAWRLMQKAVLVDAFDQPAVDRYFAVRQVQGFNVLQTVAASDGQVINSAGHPAFENADFTRPRTIDGPDNDYWDQCDAILDLAQAYGFYVALLPLWLNNIEDDHPLVQNALAAYRYGRFLGHRYRRRTNIVWVLGGDPYLEGRDVDRPERLRMVRAMAEGIADGVGDGDGYDRQADWSTTLMTYHPRGGGHSSSEHLHDEAWLDFNMVQTTTRFDFANYATIAADVARMPPKPTLDAEVAYEYSFSLRQKEDRNMRIRAWDVRRAAYWSVFAGACGHTYGHRSLIGWTRMGEKNNFGADMPWYDALDAPGAMQMGYLGQLAASDGFGSRIADQTVIADNPGRGFDHARAARDTGGGRLWVYLPTGKPVDIRTDQMSGSVAELFWFNPRDGSELSKGTVNMPVTRYFEPPTRGNGQDWVLMLRCR